MYIVIIEICLEGRTYKVLNCFTFLRTRQEQLQGHFVAAACCCASEFADRQIIGIGNSKHIVFDTEHKDDSIGVEDLISLLRYDSISIIIKNGLTIFI